MQSLTLYTYVLCLGPPRSTYIMFRTRKPWWENTLAFVSALVCRCTTTAKLINERTNAASGAVCTVWKSMAIDYFDYSEAGLGGLLGCKLGLPLNCWDPAKKMGGRGLKMFKLKLRIENWIRAAVSGAIWFKLGTWAHAGRTQLPNLQTPNTTTWHLAAANTVQRNTMQYITIRHNFRMVMWNQYMCLLLYHVCIHEKWFWPEVIVCICICVFVYLCVFVL